MRNVKKIRKLVAVFLLFLTSFAAVGLSSQKSQLEAMYDKAFKAFDGGKYDEALKVLDAIDAQQPDLAESRNLRGVVYMRQGKYDKAEAALRKALSIEPKFWNASFNLAEIPFLRKDWGEARNRFEALVAGDNQDLQPETTQLIQYKILLTFVLQGKLNTVDWITNKFESAKDSPALYYSNAAMAFQHGNQKEAAEWVSAAGKHFSEPLNKLYAESLYEIGWMQKPAGEARPAIEITSTTERAERLKADAKVSFEKAERAFQQRDFANAIKFLDQAEAAVPKDAASTNLRGEILMEQGKFDEADAAFHEAVADDPKFREAQYNLALIAFKKKDYDKARDQFESLFSAVHGQENNQASQLLKYKIFMTLLLQGKDVQAQQLMDQFKFTGNTPALYYAHAAWEYQHAHGEQGNDWVESARKIYNPALNVVFSDSFYDLGWLQKGETAEAPPTMALAQVNASPPTGPKPEMRLGQAEPLPSPALGVETGVATPATPGPSVAEMITAATPGASAASTAESIETTPAASAAPSIAAIAAASPEATAVQGAEQPTSNVAASTTTINQPIAAPVAVVQKSTASPVTHPSASRAMPVSNQNFADIVDRVSRPRTLLVGTFLLAGILLLVWLVVQQARRNMASVPLYSSSTPLTEPPLTHGGGDLREERKGTKDFISTGPPKLSLNLKASEPTVRTPVFPTGPITARGAVPGVDEPLTTQPSEQLEEPEVASVPLTVEPAPAGPLRDREEVSLPGKPPEPAKVSSEVLAIEPIVVAEAVPAEEIAALRSTAAETRSKEGQFASELVEGITQDAEDEMLMAEEPVGQGQPVPELTTSLSPDLIVPELTQTEPESQFELVEAQTDVAVATTDHQRSYSAIETPPFASKIISAESIILQPTTPVIMPETTITPASTPTFRPASPTMSVQQPAGSMHTAVQLTFSLEIASMQLTPTFKMSGLQLKPISRVVSMRLAPSQDPQPPMNLQVTFEVARIELANGSLGTIRLSPSIQEKPAVLTSPSFAISGLELVPGKGAAPVQLTPSHQEQASVHLTAEFQIAAIEFTPNFEISTIVLNSTSRRVSMQLPGSGPSSIDSAPVFEIENVQLGAGNELGLIQVTPGGGAPRLT
jgi:tetratricopeptide (TPR) repeat protein